MLTKGTTTSWGTMKMAKMAVGVMCADEGHYDAQGQILDATQYNVGVMCADEGHYDTSGDLTSR